VSGDIDAFGFEAPARRFLMPAETFAWKADCRHFNGDLPCRHWRPCTDCDKYSPVGRRYLLIMLGLHGDMLIASPLPPRIKREHPDAHITWLCDAEHAPLMEMNPAVDRVLAYSWETVRQLERERFHAIYCFERTPGAAALMETVACEERAGLAYGGPSSGLHAVGAAAEHFFKMNTWNDYRTVLNTKTWTELYFEVAGYTYNNEPYALDVPEHAHESMRQLAARFPSQEIIGFNLGSSLPTKMWPTDHWVELGLQLLDEGASVWLFAGPKENAMAEEVRARLLPAAGDRVHYQALSLTEFCAAVGLCTLLITGDTFGYHLGLLHRTPMVALFGPSHDAEVVPKAAHELTILKSSTSCSPCAHQVACGGMGGCMGSILSQDVASAARNHLVVSRT
jgi:heptosyltransferase-1